MIFDVAAMQAVEVAQREDRLLPARGTTVVGKVNDVHGPRAGAAARSIRQSTLKSTDRPSYASCTCGGRLACGRRVTEVVADVGEPCVAPGGCGPSA